MVLLFNALFSPASIACRHYGWLSLDGSDLTKWKNPEFFIYSIYMFLFVAFFFFIEYHRILYWEMLKIEIDSVEVKKNKKWKKHVPVNMEVRKSSNWEMLISQANKFMLNVPSQKLF